MDKCAPRTLKDDEGACPILSRASWKSEWKAGHAKTVFLVENISREVTSVPVASRPESFTRTNLNHEGARLIPRRSRFAHGAKLPVSKRVRDPGAQEDCSSQCSDLARQSPGL